MLSYESKNGYLHNRLFNPTHFSVWQGTCLLYSSVTMPKYLAVALNEN
jgi:hypothetical protein